MKQKLNAKDFILIGVLTALMWIICMIISTIMSVAGPVTNVFYPSVVATGCASEAFPALGTASDIT